ncbi:MAG: hypothetical protein OK438_01080 [Thaumarchaeota archaeon]|nr:hypothetical protein [Nitrososphaerota archaeon]
MVECAGACLQKGVVEFGSGTDELKKQLKEQEMVIGAWDKPRYAHPEGLHDDLAWAFMMALYVGRRWLTGNGTWAIRLY